MKELNENDLMYELNFNKDCIKELLDSDNNIDYLGLPFGNNCLKINLIDPKNNNGNCKIVIFKNKILLEDGDITDKLSNVTKSIKQAMIKEGHLYLTNIVHGFDIDEIERSLGNLTTSLYLNKSTKLPLRTDYKLLFNKETNNYEGITMPIHDVDYIVGGIENVKEFINNIFPNQHQYNNLNFVKKEELGVYLITGFIFD